MTMLPELRDELDQVLELLRDRAEVAARLPARKQRALARHLATFRAHVAGDVEVPTETVQHRAVSMLALFSEAESLPTPRPPPATSRLRLRRGTHLRAVDP